MMLRFWPRSCLTSRTRLLIGLAGRVSAGSSPRTTSELSCNILQGLTPSSCRWQLQASRGKAADYNGSSGEDEEDWTPRFVQEQQPREGDPVPDAPQQEDPAAVENAKEKFWGRIAVISLGVSSVIQDLVCLAQNIVRMKKLLAFLQLSLKQDRDFTKRSCSKGGASKQSWSSCTCLKMGLSCLQKAKRYVSEYLQESSTIISSRAHYSMEEALKRSSAGCPAQREIVWQGHRHSPEYGHGSTCVGDRARTWAHCWRTCGCWNLPRHQTDRQQS